MSQGCSQGLLPQICPKGAQEHPANRRYPLDAYCPKYQEHNGTPRDQDQDIWQDQEVLARSRPPAKPSSGKTMINHSTTLQPVTVEKRVIM